MLQETFPVGLLGCNCTILACEDRREACIIDPGGDAPRILEIVRAHDLIVKYLLHTHAHLDHVDATGELCRATGAQVLLHEGDRWLYENIDVQGRMFGLPTNPAKAPVTRWLADGEELAFGLGAKTIVLHTPGHTPGSCCFRFERQAPVVFSGDTLFARSVGRTDLWGGSFPALEQSIRARLYTLEDDTLVIPGHGPATHIGYEKKHNAFVTA